MRAFLLFGILLILVGIVAAICLTPFGAGLVIVSLISVVGIPIGFFILAAPTLFLLLLFAGFFFGGLSLFGLPIHWSIRLLVSLSLSAGVLALPPYFINRDLHERAVPLLAGDMDLTSGPMEFETLAVVVPGRYNGAYSCDDFCQRALVNEQVGRIIMVQARQPVDGIDWSETGNVFWLEKRDTCPAVDVREGVRTLSLPEKDTGLRGKSVSDVIRLRSATGTCFLTGKALLTEADAVIFSGQIKKGVSQIEAGFNTGADTISASRSSLYIKQGDGFVTAHQSTRVKIEQLRSLLIPTRIFGYQFKNGPGLLRESIYLGASKPKYPDTPFTFLVTKVLGLSLAIDDNSIQSDTRRLIVEALAQSGEVSQSNVDVIKDYLEDTGRAKQFDQDDLALVLRILEDRRLPVLPHTASAVRQIPERNVDIADQFARILFQRLQELGPRHEDDRARNRQLRSITSAIYVLPTDSIDPYVSQLENLAENEADRIHARSALRRLGDFGTRAVPTLLFLIDDANRYSNRPVTEEWQLPYLAGIEGLCRMGALGMQQKQIIPELILRLEDGRIAKFASYWSLAINTLLAHGADPEEIWPYMKTDNVNHTRKKFDWEISRAKKKFDCFF